MTIKIGLYLGASPECGGAYQYSKALLDALLAHQAQYRIIVAYSNRLWQPYLYQLGDDAVYIPENKLWLKAIGLFRRLWVPVWAIRKLIQYVHPLYKKLQSLDCRLWFFPAQDSYAYLLPLNTVSTIHDLMHRFEPHFKEVGAGREVRWREFHYKQTCKYAKAVLVDSELGKQQVMQCYERAKPNCQVLPYIASPDILKHKASLLPFELPQKYIFYPAQFWQHKNHARLITAIHELRKKIPDITCILVGSPKNAYSEVKKLITLYGLEDKVKILGLIKDEYLPELYRRARALVMPTYFGPTNIPPLEAFAFGCPVAISGIYAIPQQCQDAAIYFDPNKVNELAASIERLWLDDKLCHSLIRAGYKRHDQWNFKQFSQKVGNILSELT